jgi:hypothetical protein
MRISIALACLTLLACGGSSEHAPPPSQPDTHDEQVENEAPASVAIDGEWSGGSSGGPIQSSLTWRFHGGEYSMDGYPAIGETGHYAITSDTPAADGSHSLVVHFSSSMSCEHACRPGEGTPRDDRDVSMQRSADGSTLTFGSIAFARLPAVDS